MTNGVTSRHLRELRKFLKNYRATPLDASHQEQADIITGLIPALVDSITDEELSSLLFNFSDYLMNSIIHPPAAQEPPEKEQPIAPSVVLTDL